MKWNREKYDERQILEQGRAFRWGFFAALMTFVLFYILQECLGLHIDGYTVFISGIWMPLSVCLILQIVKDAYDYVDSAAGRPIISAFGLVGLGVSGYTVLEAILGNEPLLYRDGMVTESTGRLVMGCCMVLVALVYWGKQLYNQKHREEEYGKMGKKMRAKSK